MVDYDPAIGVLGLGSLEIESGLETILQLIDLYAAPTPAFSLLRCSLELLQIEVGSVHQVLSIPFKLFSPLPTSSWFKSVWEFM